MDPLSILKIAGTAASTAKTAWDVGEALYTFIGNVKVIDQTVSDMIAEVKALSSACTLVDERLRDIVTKFDSEVRRPTTDRQKLWTCVELQVANSKLSVVQLESALKSVKQDGSNSFAQAWRQIKLNMKAKDIEEARNRIRSHTASLQTILQTVAIEICYVVPQRADQQLRTLLSGMSECLERLQSLRRARDRWSPNDSEQTVIQMSESVASRGESLYAASVASGSLRGDSTETTLKVREWMSDIHAIDEILSRPEDNVGQSDAARVLGGNSTAPRYRKPYKPTPMTHDDFEGSDGMDVDSDDEFAVEVAREALSVARSSFESKNYHEATASLKEALKMVRELPAKQQRICDTFELRYMLSVCTFYNQPPAEAEGDLLSVLDTSSRTNAITTEQLRQVCEAGHLLSQTYVKLGKLDQARLYCDNALQGRRRILGKTSNEVYASIALMAHILTLQGDDFRAKVYLSLIPATEMDAIERANEDIKPLTMKETGPECESTGLQAGQKALLSTQINRPDRGDVSTLRDQTGMPYRVGKALHTIDEAKITSTANSSPSTETSKAPVASGQVLGVQKRGHRVLSSTTEQTPKGRNPHRRPHQQPNPRSSPSEKQPIPPDNSPQLSKGTPDQRPLIDQVSKTPIWPKPARILKHSSNLPDPFNTAIDFESDLGVISIARARGPFESEEPNSPLGNWTQLLHAIARRAWNPAQAVRAEDHKWLCLQCTGKAIDFIEVCSDSLEIAYHGRIDSAMRVIRGGPIVRDIWKQIAKGFWKISKSRDMKVVATVRKLTEREAGILHRWPLPSTVC